MAHLLCYAVSIHTNCYPSCSSASAIPVTKMADWWDINSVWKSWVLSLPRPLRRPVARQSLHIVTVKMITNTNSPLPKSKTSPGCCCFSNLILQHDDKLPVGTNKSILHTDGQLLKENRHTKRCCRPSCIKHKTNSNNWWKKAFLSVHRLLIKKKERNKQRSMFWKTSENYDGIVSTWRYRPFARVNWECNYFGDHELSLYWSWCQQSPDVDLEVQVCFS